MVLRTNRLTLRPFRSDDVEAFRAFAHLDEYRRYLGVHPEPAEFVENNVDVDGAWVIELDGRVVGSAFLGEELACLLDPAVHGQGIGVEAARAVIEDGFGRRGYDEIVARADPRNTASRRAMARLGFVATAGEQHVLRRDAYRPRG